MEPLRIGVLGAARISARAIVEPAGRTGHRLVAVAARDRSRAEAFAQEHGVERVHDDYASVLADPDVEAVYNPLANGLHAPWNLAALAAGKHVLTEKPSAVDAGEARAVRDAAAAAGLVAAEAFHYRYHPLAGRLLEVAAGEIGGLRDVEVTMVMPPPADGDPRWSLPLAGGALMDVGCYGLHLLRALGALAGGEPRVVAADARERGGVDETMTVELAFPSGVTGRVVCGMTAAQRDFSCRLTGASGKAWAPSFAIPDLDDRLVVTPMVGAEWTERLGVRTSYTYQLEAFVSAVREHTPLPTGADDAVAQAELVDACYAAAGMAPRPRSAVYGDATAT